MKAATNPGDEGKGTGIPEKHTKVWRNQHFKVYPAHHTTACRPREEKLARNLGLKKSEVFALSFETWVGERSGARKGLRRVLKNIRA